MVALQKKTDVLDHERVGLLDCLSPDPWTACQNHDGCDQELNSRKWHSATTVADHDGIDCGRVHFPGADVAMHWDPFLLVVAALDYLGVGILLEKC